MNRPRVYICPSILNPPSHHSLHPITLDCAREPALDSLLHVLNLPWSSILHVVVYMFQRYSLRSSHPHLLPLSAHRFASAAQKNVSVMWHHSLHQKCPVLSWTRVLWLRLCSYTPPTTCPSPGLWASTSKPHSKFLLS